MPRLVLPAVAIFLLLLCGRDFWDPDEPRFAEVSREMLATGDWLLPRFNGRPLALLPPLTYWASAVASWPIGDVTPWTGRLPIVAFALLALTATALIPARGGAWSALVLLSTNLFLLQAQRLQSDMILIGTQVWALAAFYRARGAPRPGPWLLSGYLAVGLAVLAKGPLGALLPGAVFGLFLLAEGDTRALRRMGLGWGVPLVAAIVLPWYFAACSYGGDAFCRELVLKHNFGMFFDTWSHAQPFYYYLLHAPIVFLPWTLLLPAAVRGMSRDAETRFLLVWVAFAFAFFSVSEAKQAKYLLPLLPPLAILVGRWAAEAQPKPSRELLVAALALLVALSAATIAALLVLPERLPGTTRAAVAGVLPALALLGAAAAHWKRRPAAVALIAASVLVTALAAQLSLVPALEDYKSPRTLVDAAAALGHPVAIHGIAYRQTGGLVFYSGGPLPLLESSEAFHEYMAAPEPRLAYVSRKAFRGEYPVIIDSPYRDGTVLVRNWAEEEP